MLKVVQLTMPKVFSPVLTSRASVLLAVSSGFSFRVTFVWLTFPKQNKTVSVFGTVIVLLLSMLKVNIQY